VDANSFHHSGQGIVMSNKVSFRMIFLGFLLQFCCALFAQEKLLPFYNFRHLGTEEQMVLSRVVRDHQGYIWIGTRYGLNRYDGYGVRVYIHDPDDPYSLSSNTVKSLFEDSKQRLWVGTYDTGLSLYDEVHDRFINFLPSRGDPTWYESKSIVGMMEDRSGNLWLAGQAVLRVEIPPIDGSQDPDSLTSGIHFTTYPLGTHDIWTSALSQREDGTILVASDSGLIILNPTTHKVSRSQITSSAGRMLDSIPLICMLQDSHGNTWLGTATAEGIFRIDWESKKVWNYRHKKEHDLSRISDIIHDMAEDRDGNIWIGSEAGVYLFSPITGQYIPYLTADASLSKPNSQTLFSFDRTGTFWIGTAGSGVHWLSQKLRRISSYGIQDGTGSSPINLEAAERDQNGNFWLFSAKGVLYQLDVSTLKILKTIDVFAGKKPSNYWNRLFIDTHGTFWCGSFGLGLFRVDLGSGKVSNYCREAGLGKDCKIISITQGLGDTLWITTGRDGLMKFDPKSEKFSTVPDAPDRAFAVMRDHLGNVWTTTESNGIIVLDPITGKRDHFFHDPSNPYSLSNDHTRFTYEDEANRIWIGAGNMIDLWNPATRSFTHYPNPEFNKALWAEPMGSDSKGRIWVRYQMRGVSVLNPSTGIYINFDHSDGNNDTDMEALPDGRNIIVGWAGMNIINLDSINLNLPPPPLVLTRTAINEETIDPPAFSKGLQLSFAQNVLEFEFAAIDIDAPHLIRYHYQLEGLEKNWVNPQNRRYVRYPGLPPGNYIFKVRAASIRGDWDEQEISLAVSIAPPWWRTIGAYSGYLLLIIGLLAAAYRMRLRQVQIKQQMEMEHFQAEHLAEVDRLKSRFFANISHEFRTPLTLILGPIEKLRSLTTGKEAHNMLGMMKRNAQQLLRLINQLLDLSKIEAGAMQLQARPGNIVPLVRGISYSFESSAGLRNIDLKVSTGQNEIQMYFDRDKIEKIITNLLANAFKFTPDGGCITIGINVAKSGAKHSLNRGETNLSPLEKGNKEDRVQITVTDNGIGIPQDKLPHIFDRFYQVDSSSTREQGGTGIGLALVKELVEMHHGTIHVSSQPRSGTEFTVSLPLGREHLQTEEIVSVRTEKESSIPVVETLPEASLPEQEMETKPARKKGKSLILIVEDNGDVRQYIRENLPPDCHVLEATDGLAGIEKALEIIPDLIISDVMMPRRDGYELCRTLKNDERTSHIPIILLTAKAASENKIEGLQTGADDYLIKPFEPKELAARVTNLIELRRKLRERFATVNPLQLSDVTVSSVDEAFLKKVLSAVEANLADEGFHLEELSQRLGMSRTQLYRKLTALTGQAPWAYIRFIRLHRAMGLLQKNSGTVSEIAYRVGFNDPSYFSKCFHKQFGKSPTAVQKTIKQI
jgi:signal transduction histidine kinase/DNA-binding response OmpR family regulator/ligand-binding sensor domain-containing protein